MTTQGIMMVDFIGVALITWILYLTRKGRLYVGYGVLFVLAIVSGMFVVSIPFLLKATTRLLGAIFPVSALTMLALTFVFLILVYILSQLTVISNRLSRVVQELAIRQAQKDVPEGLPLAPPLKKKTED